LFAAETLEPISVRAADSQSLAAFQHENELAVRIGSDLLDVVDVDYRRAMDTQEASRI